MKLEFEILAPIKPTRGKGQLQEDSSEPSGVFGKTH